MKDYTSVIIKKYMKKATLFHKMIVLIMSCGFLFAGSPCLTVYAGNSTGSATEQADVKAEKDTKAEKYIKSERIGIIYTGDSRIRRLNLTINMKGMKDTWVVCKSGMGYNWFVREGIPRIDKLMKEKKYIDKWVIVSGWGVNDLWNSGTYINRYTSLLNGSWSECDLWLMSVNPVNGNMKSRYNSIPLFNSKIKSYVNKSGENVFYIDTNKTMLSKGFSTIDGLHYTEGTNRLIYRTIRDEMGPSYAAVSYKSIEINKNSQRTLTLNNYEGSVKWKSSDSNIVKIISTGGTNNESVTLKAMNPGTATVRACIAGREAECEASVTDNKVMVAYFSCFGETERVAEYIQRRVGGELVWIDTHDVYPYTEKKLAVVAKNELEAEARPALDTYIADMSQYDTIYLGFPLWYGFAPRAVCTFIESYDMSGKLIRPFIITQENENCSDSIAEIKRLIRDAVVEEPFTVDRENVLTKKAKKAIRKAFAD